MEFHKYDMLKFFNEYGLDYNIFTLFRDMIYDYKQTNDDGPWIAGGALRRAILKQPANESDIDIFFRNSLQLKHFGERLRLCGYKLVHQTEHSSFYKCVEEPIDNLMFKYINLVFIDYYSQVEKLLDTFDYTICQFATDFNLKTLYCGETSLFDTANKRLKIHNITYPNASLRRMIKYGKQGFIACDGTIVSFLNAVRGMPEEMINLNNFKYID